MYVQVSTVIIEYPVPISFSSIQCSSSSRSDESTTYPQFILFLIPSLHYLVHQSRILCWCIAGNNSFVACHQESRLLRNLIVVWELKPMSKWHRLYVVTTIVLFTASWKHLLIINHFLIMKRLCRWLEQDVSHWRKPLPNSKIAGIDTSFCRKWKRYWKNGESWNCMELSSMLRWEGICELMDEW